ATEFFGTDDAAHTALIQRANPTVSFPAPAGTVIQFPFAETAGNLLRYYGVGLATLLSPANVADPKLLAPRAVLAIPPVEPAITAADTLGALAQRYNLTLDDVADQLGPVTGLFRDADKTAGAPQLTIPYVPALAIDDLVAQIGVSDKANQSAAMASRFLLNGLRIPDPRDPAFQKNPQDPDLLTYPLLALTGQELAAPTDGAAYALTLTKTGTATWLDVPAGGLAVPLSSAEQQQIADFGKTAFAPGVQRCERLALSAAVRDQQALQTALHWQAGELPSLGSSAAIAGEPTLWPLPDALQTSVAHVAQSGVPYELVVVTPDPTGGSTTAAVSAARWATTVDVTIAKIPAHGGDAANLAGTFLVLGADQLGTERLLAVMKQLASDSATLYLLYPPNPTDVNGSGYVSDAFDASDPRAEVVLLKTNLSTLSNGTPKLGARRAARVALRAAQDDYSATLDPAQSKTFVELLWECSVVRSGGFYLSYRAAGGATFPDRIFGPNGEAALKLVVLFGSQPSAAGSLLLPLNNALVLGDNVDTSRSTLYARTAVRQVVAGDTLTTVAAAFPLLTLDPAALATANAGVPNLLRPGATISVNGANQPIAPLATFASIGAAAKPPVTPAALGTANATADILQTGALIQPLLGELRVEATQRPGNTGFLVIRDDPQQPANAGRAQGTADAQSEVNALFNLLGFRVVGNAWFAASGEGLPAGPTDDAAAPARWTYRQALNAASFALPAALAQIVPDCAALPPAAQNPYAGIAAGAKVDLSLAFRELDGNRSTFPALTPSLPVGYTDQLLGIARWPSTSCAYEFDPVGGGAQLAVDWTFSAQSYQPAAGADFPATQKKARTDAARAAAAYYQLRMPDAGVALSTSIAALAGDPQARSAALKLALQDYLGSAYVYLSAAQALRQVSAPTDGKTLNGIAADFETAPGTLAHANASAKPAALFAGPTLALPQYYRVNAGDTMTSIAAALLPKGTPAERLALIEALAGANAELPLRAGTALVAAIRSVTVVDANLDLASVAALAASQHAAVGDLGPVAGFAGSNTGAALTKGNVLSYDGAPPLTVGDSQTLAGVVTA
ncbi:MAG: hypothetical protein QOI11_1711, partial [Candidatus Eremiobacteraeota bacterium]|nr:hypothetical protein [Candidatus Eremiobacteraeota bacterium]